MSRSFAVILASLAALALAQKCHVQFDGRVPTFFAVETFNLSNGVFSPDFVHGENLAWSDILKLDLSLSTLFDIHLQTVEVTITDESIFAPNPNLKQTGFRRAELLAFSNNGSDPSTVGVKTVHFSIKKDDTRPLNTTHEYQLVFLEDATFSTNQVVLKTGTVAGGAGTSDPDTLQLFGNVNDDKPGMIFSKPFAPDVFHNFGITLNFDMNTTQVFYSTGKSPLKQVTKPIANDLSGRGQFHFGMLKKGIGGGDNVVVDAFQPTGIDEGVIYGGIFEEDSADGCISLSP